MPSRIRGHRGVWEQRDHFVPILGQAMTALVAPRRGLCSAGYGHTSLVTGSGHCHEGIPDDQTPSSSRVPGSEGVWILGREFLVVEGQRTELSENRFHPF
jgi:hypothetical protein